MTDEYIRATVIEAQQVIPERRPRVDHSFEGPDGVAPVASRLELRQTAVVFELTHERREHSRSVAEYPRLCLDESDGLGAEFRVVSPVHERLILIRKESWVDVEYVEVGVWFFRLAYHPVARIAVVGRRREHKTADRQ